MPDGAVMTAPHRTAVTGVSLTPSCARAIRCTRCRRPFLDAGLPTQICQVEHRHTGGATTDPPRDRVSSKWAAAAGANQDHHHHDQRTFAEGVLAAIPRRRSWCRNHAAVTCRCDGRWRSCCPPRAPNCGVLDVPYSYSYSTGSASGSAGLSQPVSSFRIWPRRRTSADRSASPTGSASESLRPHRRLRTGRHLRSAERQLMTTALRRRASSASWSVDAARRRRTRPRPAVAPVFLRLPVRRPLPFATEVPQRCPAAWNPPRLIGAPLLSTRVASHRWCAERHHVC